MAVFSDHKPMRILLVEDHADIAENIGDYLEGKGHIIDFAMDGLGGMHLALTHTYDVIILDIMLPGMDGLTLCRKLRQEAHNQTPVLMLTARDTLSDKLHGYGAGTDDYLVKPFAMQELEARVQAIVRRKEPEMNRVLQVSNLELDTGSMMVCRAGRPIAINRSGLKILKILMQAYPNMVTRSELENALWGDTLPGSDSLRSHIYALRRKIDRPFKKPMLETVHGIGYRLVGTDEIST